MEPIPDNQRKRKETQTNTNKTNKRTKSLKTSSLFPKQDNRDAKKDWKKNTKEQVGFLVLWLSMIAMMIQKKNNYSTNDQYRSVSDCAKTQVYLGLYWSHMAYLFSCLGMGQWPYSSWSILRIHSPDHDIFYNWLTLHSILFWQRYRREGIQRNLRATQRYKNVTESL